MTPKQKCEIGNIIEQQPGESKHFATKQHSLKPFYHSTAETGFFREVLLFMISPQLNAYSDLLFKTLILHR